MNHLMHFDFEKSAPPTYYQRELNQIKDFTITLYRSLERRGKKTQNSNYAKEFPWARRQIQI